MRRCWTVRVAHAEVDDVLTSAACLRLRRVDLGEHVRRQAADAVELTGLIGTHVRSFGMTLQWTRRAEPPRPIASAATWTAEGGTPADAKAAAIACARDRPS